MSALPFKNPQCPACCNKDTDVELMVPMPHNADMDEYSCHCGKCGSIFRAVLERHVWLAQPVRSESAELVRLVPARPIDRLRLCA
jgi:hypothetical protein